MNKPKEFRFFRSKWGIGYPNPQNFGKSVKLVPTLYDFKFLDLGTRYPHLGLKWTDMSEEDREKEEIRRNKSTKMKLPFCYDTLIGDTYDKRIPTNPKTLSNDYFHSYSTTELEAQPIEGKLYVPPLILESKIVQLEEQLEINQYIFEIEKDFLMTILLNHESESFSKLEDIPESNESILSDSDASSCKAFIGSSIFKNVSFANNTNEPSISSSNGKTSVMDDSSESDIFNDCLDSCLFDFNTTLPDHNSFLFNTKEIPSVWCKGESSKTNGKVVPETSFKTEGNTKRKSRKRSKKKKSLKLTSPETNFSKSSSSGSPTNGLKGVKQVWRLKLPTSDVGSTKKPVTKSSENDEIKTVKHNRAFYLQKQSVVFPSKISNIKHLIKFSQNLIRCSNCGSGSFVDKHVTYNNHNHHHAYIRKDNYDSHLYNHHSYYHYNYAKTPYLYRKPEPSFKWIPKTDHIANLKGPIFKWVPKTV